MLQCKQVTTMVAGDDLADAGPWLWLKIRLHLVMCRHCARYAAQIRSIGAKARERFQSPEQRSDVDDLQQRILEAAGKPRNKRDPS